MKQLEDENRKLTHGMAELTLDNRALKDVLSKTGSACGTSGSRELCRGGARAVESYLKESASQPRGALGKREFLRTTMTTLSEKRRRHVSPRYTFFPFRLSLTNRNEGISTYLLVLPPVSQLLGPSSSSFPQSAPKENDSTRDAPHRLYRQSKCSRRSRTAPGESERASSELRCDEHHADRMMQGCRRA